MRSDPSTHRRSLLKAFSWETISLILTFLLAWLFFGHVVICAMFAWGSFSLKRSCFMFTNVSGIKSRMERGMTMEKKSKKTRQRSNLTPLQADKKIRRNGPCPCGSGKKAKHCCLNHIKRLAAIPARLREQFFAMSILNKPFGEIDSQLPVEPQSTININECTIEVATNDVENMDTSNPPLNENKS